VARPDACATDLDCRAGFGWGSTCTDDGFCAAPAPPARCERTLPEDLFQAPERYADRIVVGALYDPVAHLDSIQASELAITEVNQEDGLDGQEFALVVCDYGEGEDGLSSTEAAAEGAQWLADGLGVSAILGPRGSSRAKAAFEALDERDVVLISPSATSPELTEIDETMPTDERPGRLWRTVPPDTLQGEVIVADLVARNVTNVAVIAQEGSYGDALAALLDSGFEQQGGTLDIFSYANTPFGPIADVSAGDYEEVVFVSSDIGDYVKFLEGAVASGDLLAAYDGMGIFLTDAGFSPELLTVSESSQVLFDNIRGSRPAPAEGPLFDTFAAAFTTLYGTSPEESGFTVHSYDAAWLIFYAYAWAHFNEEDEGGRSLARGLRKVSDGTPAGIRPSGWDTVLEAFGSGASVDVAGGSGELDYDPATEETSAPIEIWGIEEPNAGEFQFYEIETVG
jgi:branched-chain amino acid transport system substrate-binding protein